MKCLALEDFANMSVKEIKDKIVSDFQVKKSDIEPYKILIAYMHVGSWGCDSSAFLLLQHKISKELFQVHGSHCSCNGFEEQFSPEKTILDTTMKTYGFFTGGYDGNSEHNKKIVQERIEKLSKLDINNL